MNIGYGHKLWIIAFMYHYHPCPPPPPSSPPPHHHHHPYPPPHHHHQHPGFSNFPNSNTTLLLLSELLVSGPRYFFRAVSDQVNITSNHMYLDVSETRGISPQIIHFDKVFHYFHHPFWGTPIFGNTHLYNVNIHWFQECGYAPPPKKKKNMNIFWRPIGSSGEPP